MDLPKYTDVISHFGKTKEGAEQEAQKWVEQFSPELDVYSDIVVVHHPEGYYIASVLCTPIPSLVELNNEVFRADAAERGFIDIVSTYTDETGAAERVRRIHHLIEVCRQAGDSEERIRKIAGKYMPAEKVQ